MDRKKRKKLGVVFLALGVLMWVFALYIMGEVEKGRGELSSAQEKVDRSQGLFGLTPVTKGIGKGMTDAAQKKINMYGEEADQYEAYAQYLKIGGTLCLLLGGFLWFFPRKV